MTREDVFKKASAGRVISGASWQLSLGAITALMLFLWSIIATRAFGPEGWFFFVFAQSLITTFTIISFPFM